MKTDDELDRDYDEDEAKRRARPGGADIGNRAHGDLAANNINDPSAQETREQLVARWGVTNAAYLAAQDKSDLAYQDTAFELFEGSFTEFQERRTAAAAAAFDDLYAIERKLVAAGYVERDGTWIDDEEKRRAGHGGGDMAQENAHQSPEPTPRSDGPTPAEELAAKAASDREAEAWAASFDARMEVAAYNDRMEELAEVRTLDRHIEQQETDGIAAAERELAADAEHRAPEASNIEDYNVCVDGQRPTDPTPSRAAVNQGIADYAAATTQLDTALDTYPLGSDEIEAKLLARDNIARDYIAAVVEIDPTHDQDGYFSAVLDHAASIGVSKSDAVILASESTLDLSRDALRSMSFAEVDEFYGHDAPSTKQGAQGLGDAATALAARIMESAASPVATAIESLATAFESLFGGGSSAPAPQQESPSTAARQTHAERVNAFIEAERQQRAAERQEIARSLGAGDAMTEEELHREQEAQHKRSRDRGGGQSL